MPFYDFRCVRCGATEEFLLAIDAPGPAIHAGCGGALERMYAPTSIHFKGSGWAKLDRRGTSGDATGGASGGSSGEAAAPAAGEKKAKPSGE